MSRVLSCSVPNGSLTTNIARVSKFVRTNYIVPNGNGEVHVQGLTPSVVVANVPIDVETFDANGSTIIGFIADRSMRLVSVGEIHAVASSVNSQISLTKNGTDSLVTVDTLTLSTLPRVKLVNSVNNVLSNGDLLVLKLVGGIPTNLAGGVITLTFVVL